MKSDKVSIFQLLAMGGFFAYATAIPAAELGNWNWDSQFGVPGVTGYGVTEMAGDGRNLYIAGAITSVNGVGVTNLAKWDGSGWSGVGGGVGTGLWEGIGALTTFGGYLYAGGVFTQAGGIPATNVAKWDGTNWLAVGSGVDGYVSVLTMMDRYLIAGGQFKSASGISALRIARWDGINWSSMGSITNFTPNCHDDCFDDGAVFALAVRGHELFVGGRFVYAGGVFATNIAKWDGTNWSALGPGVSGQVEAIAVSGNDIYAVGGFRKAGNLIVNGIARWDGTRWYDLAGGVSDFLSVSVVVPNGKDIYVGGPFRHIGGISAEHIAKWDGRNWSALGSGMGGGLVAGVGALASNGTELFVGGFFPTAGGNPSTNIALWHIPHALSIRRAADAALLSWPATGTNFLLEACSDLGHSKWTEVLQAPVLSGPQLVVTQEVCALSRFYRLRRR